MWSLLENSRPISGKDFGVKIFVRYIAVCLGLTKYLDLLEDNISFLLILKNLQTIVCIVSIFTLFSVRFIENKVNEYMNTILKTHDNVDYIIASDTDSIYLTLDKLIEATCKDKSKEHILRFINKVVDSRIQPFLDKCFAELADYTNAIGNKMVMKREVIADKGIWTAKKRYMLNVLDEEGIVYEKPKLNYLR